TGIGHHDRSNPRSDVAMAGRWKPRLEILRAAPRVNRSPERRARSLRVDCAEKITETMPAHRRHSTASRAIADRLSLIRRVSALIAETNLIRAPVSGNGNPIVG